jgi:hypothetical protein
VARYRRCYVGTPRSACLVVVAKDENRLAREECVILRKPLRPVSGFPRSIEVAHCCKPRISVSRIGCSLHYVFAVLFAFAYRYDIRGHEVRELVENAPRRLTVCIDARNPALTVRPVRAEGLRAAALWLIAALLVQHLAGLIAVVILGYKLAELFREEAFIWLCAGDLRNLPLRFGEGAARNLRLELKTFPPAWQPLQ